MTILMIKKDLLKHYKNQKNQGTMDFAVIQVVYSDVKKA
jgi:hypothetical protein